MDVLPDCPPLSDVVPGYEASSWEGVGAPKRTSPEIVDKLNAHINAAFTDSHFKARLAGRSGPRLSGQQVSGRNSWMARVLCPLCAKNGHMRRSQILAYSITSSALDPFLRRAR